MNGMERYFDVVTRYRKQLKLSFTFASLVVLLAISMIALVAEAQEATTTEETGGEVVENQEPLPEEDTSEEVPGEGEEVVITEDNIEADSDTEVSGDREAGASTTTDTMATTAAEETVSETTANNEAVEDPTGEAISTTNGLTEAQQKRITNLAANISNRLDALVTRLEGIITRLESRMNKMQEAGIATSKAEAELNLAIATLGVVKADLAGIDELVASVIGSDSPQETWVNVRDMYLSIHTNISAVKQRLLTIISLLQEPASPTPATTDDTGTSTPDKAPDVTTDSPTSSDIDTEPTDTSVIASTTEA